MHTGLLILDVGIDTGSGVLKMMNELKADQERSRRAAADGALTSGKSSLQDLASVGLKAFINHILSAYYYLSLLI